MAQVRGIATSRLLPVAFRVTLLLPSLKAGALLRIFTGTVTLTGTLQPSTRKLAFTLPERSLYTGSVRHSLGASPVFCSKLTGRSPTSTVLISVTVPPVNRISSLGC